MSSGTSAKSILILSALLAVASIGYFIGRNRSSAPQASSTRWTCSMHPQVNEPNPGLCPICHMELVPIKSAGQTNAGVIQIDPAIVQNMGVRTSVVKKGSLVRSVRVVGYLEEPEPLHRDINLRVNGWVEKLYADTDGMPITKGMALFDLYSPELTVAVDELISAHKQSTGDDTAKSLFDSSRRKLIQFGLDEAQVDELAKLATAPKTIPILSPISGHLTAKMVYEGASIKAGDLVLRLASRHRMWIDAQIYEQQMSLISDGQPAKITLVSQPGKVIEGKVLFVHPHVDPKTRTALARIEIPNQDMSLRQGMYATVDILADNYVEASVLPREAVIDTGRKQIAFVSLGDGKFESRLLTLGASGQDGTVEVISGVQTGESVVTSGQFLLDSESRVREALAKFGAAESGTPTTQPDTIATISAANSIDIPHSKEMIDAYLVVAEKLGEREADNASPIDVKPFIELGQMSAMHANDQAKALVEKVVHSAAAMQGKSIEEQRKAFIEVSNAMIAVASVTSYSRTLFQIHCPMAFHSEGADWLQDSDVIANPYYAREMKACGTVQKKIEPGKH